MIIRAFKTLSWTIIELAAAVVSLALIPILMIMLATGAAGIGIGAALALHGSDVGPNLAFGGAMALVVMVTVGFVIDYVYSFLR
jgi:hypothetical protein